MLLFAGAYPGYFVCHLFRNEPRQFQRLICLQPCCGSFYFYFAPWSDVTVYVGLLSPLRSSRGTWHILAVNSIIVIRNNGLFAIAAYRWLLRFLSF